MDFGVKVFQELNRRSRQLSPTSDVCIRSDIPTTAYPVDVETTRGSPQRHILGLPGNKQRNYAYVQEQAVPPRARTFAAYV